MMTIGLYRDVWIAAIASSTTSLATRTAAICVRFQGQRVRRGYVTMQITFLTRKSALIYRRGLRQRVASLTLNCNGDFAISAYEDFYATPKSFRDPFTSEYSSRIKNACYWSTSLGRAINICYEMKHKQCTTKNLQQF